MKRSDIRKTPAPRVTQYEGPTPMPRVCVLRVSDGNARMVVPIVKERPARSEEYRRAVAALPCAHCGQAGPSQAAHSDADGKGQRIKADDRTCYPLCAATVGRAGCHHLIGSSGLFTREHRRMLETRYAAQTRARIEADGAWPANLPRWVE